MLFTVLAGMVAPAVSQSPEEYRIQLLKYLRDGRINESLIMSVLAKQDYPDDLFFSFIGKNPDPEALLYLNPSEDLCRSAAEILMDFADALLASGNPYAGSGLKLLKKIHACNPENIEISYRYARHIYQSGEPLEKEEASRIIASLAEDSLPGGYEDEIIKFKSLLDLIEEGNIIDPVDFRKSYPEFTSDRAILGELARISMGKKACAEAHSFLEMAFQAAPSDPSLLQLQSKAFSCLGNLEKAEAAKRLSEKLFQNEETFSPLLQKARSGNRSEARNGLELMLAESPGFLDGVRLLAEIYAGEGKIIEASSLYRNYLLVFPGDSRIRSLAARMLLDQGIFDQAASLMQEDPLTETGRLISAYQMIRGGNWTGAEIILKEIIDDNPLDPLILIKLSQSLSGQGKIAEARTFLQKGLKVTPNSPELESALREIEFDYARSLSEAGRRTEAIAAYRKLAGSDPSNAQYLLNLGYEEMMNGEYKNSVIHLRQGLKLAPGEDWARSSLAYSLMYEWDYDAAVEQMKILISRNSDPDYIFQLGSIYNQIGNTQEGWALIRKAASQGHPEASRLVKQRYGKD